MVFSEKTKQRSLPEDPVVTSTSPKLKAKSPKVGQFIRVYARELQRSELMEVFDIVGNTICCGYDGIEYSVRLQETGNGGCRWEGSCN